MASSSAQHAAISALGFLPVNEKLTRSNYPLWRAQVLSSIRGAELYDFLSPTAEPPAKYLAKKEGEDKEVAPILNKEYIAWVAKDQQVLSYLLVSLSQEILQQVSSAETAAAARAGIEKLFACPITCEADQHSHGAGNHVQGLVDDCRLLLQDEGARRRDGVCGAAT
jgi:hypothetical protein